MCTPVCDSLSSNLRECGVEIDEQCCATQGVGTICALAILIIGILGAASYLQNPSIGFIVAGLAGLGFIVNAAGGKLDQRKGQFLIATLATIAIVALGIIGGLGGLTLTKMGLGIVIASAASVVLQIGAKKLA